MLCLKEKINMPKSFCRSEFIYLIKLISCFIIYRCIKVSSFGSLNHFQKENKVCFLQKKGCFITEHMKCSGSSKEQVGQSIYINHSANIISVSYILMSYQILYSANIFIMSSFTTTCILNYPEILIASFAWPAIQKKTDIRFIFGLLAHVSRCCAIVGQHTHYIN